MTSCYIENVFKAVCDGTTSVSYVCDDATYVMTRGSQDSVLVECRTYDQKVASLNPRRNGRRIFFSRVNFVCQLLFGVHSTPDTTVACKRPCSFSLEKVPNIMVNQALSLSYSSGNQLLYSTVCVRTRSNMHAVTVCFCNPANY